jgi:flagellar biosynthetic protein FliR
MEHYALPVQVFGAGLVFARIGAFIMLLPGIGETGVPAQIRLSFALLLTLALYPVVQSQLPPVPADLGGLVGQMFLEIAIGLALSALLRFFMGALAVTGEVISLASTLSFSQTTNPQQAQPTVTIGSFLSVLSLALVFSTDLHQLFIGAIVRSYTLFPPGRVAPINDLVGLAIRTMGQTFALGVQLSAPILVFSLVFHVAAGLVAKSMPQFQVFFIATPAVLLLTFALFALSLGVIGLVWLDRFHTFTAQIAIG